MANLFEVEPFTGSRDHLKPDAKKDYDSAIAALKDWHDKRWDEGELAMDAMRRLESAKQGNQSLHEWYREMKTIKDALPEKTRQHTTAKFISGLKDEELRKYAGGQVAARIGQLDLEEALGTISRYNNLVKHGTFHDPNPAEDQTASKTSGKAADSTAIAIRQMTEAIPSKSTTKLLPPAGQKTAAVATVEAVEDLDSEVACVSLKQFDQGYKDVGEVISEKAALTSPYDAEADAQVCAASTADSHAIRDVKDAEVFANPRDKHFEGDPLLPAQPTLPTQPTQLSHEFTFTVPHPAQASNLASQAQQPVPAAQGQPERKEDGLTMGVFFDKSPAATSAICKALQRPTRPTGAYSAQAASVEADGVVGAIKEAPAMLVGSQVESLAKMTLDPKMKCMYTTQTVRNKGREYNLKRILLDPGSIVDLINETAARSLNLDFTPITPFGMKFADGRRSDSHYKVLATIIIEGVERTIEAPVVSGQTPYSILMGNPSLHKFHVGSDHGPIPSVYFVREALDSKPISVKREPEDPAASRAPTSTAPTAMPTAAKSPPPVAMQKLKDWMTGDVSADSGDDEEEVNLINEGNKQANIAAS
ncbi:hypothetical protein Tdes44962_MAKER06106 [Teratosphaeria destructans]|uniref:Uncharacterized protein n=1 Tax=Teratosphaeria destructans TaxID=418781 RepID=A0A9W7SI55_9PEZI|nr:hypothetical protein Tdes44962_MAKER06106 [Teratosphaeria destructans]